MIPRIGEPQVREYVVGGRFFSGTRQYRVLDPVVKDGKIVIRLAVIDLIDTNRRGLAGAGGVEVTQPGQPVWGYPDECNCDYQD